MSKNMKIVMLVHNRVFQKPLLFLFQCLVSKPFQFKSFQNMPEIWSRIRTIKLKQSTRSVVNNNGFSFNISSPHCTNLPYLFIILCCNVSMYMCRQCRSCPSHHVQWHSCHTTYLTTGSTTSTHVSNPHWYCYPL